MTIRDLITELLDYGMDDDVQIRVNFNKDYYETDLSIDYKHNLHEIFLVADLDDYVLVEKDRLEELEDAEYRLQELE